MMRKVILAGVAYILCSQAAWGQTEPAIGIGQVPLSDVDCDNSPYPSSTPCLVTGNRVVTLTGTTRTTYNYYDEVITTANVTFDGRLQVDGAPVLTGPGPFTFPSGQDASYYFNLDGQTVDLAATYTGTSYTFVPIGAPVPARDSEQFFNINDLLVTVRSIDVHQDSTISTAAGDNYAYSLHSIDATAISEDNSVALTGQFNDQTASGALQFGRLSGTATLLTGEVLTPYPATPAPATWLCCRRSR